MIERIEDFKVAIIGGGQRCKALLQAFYDELSTTPPPVILGVADSWEHAAGMQYAREKGIFTTTDYRELLEIEDLELLLELTSDDNLKKTVKKLKPPGVLFVDHHEARAILDHLRIRTQKDAILQEIRTGQGGSQRAADLLQGFYRFVADITRAADAYDRETRQRLAASEEIMAQIIDGSTIATFVINQDHIVTHWNRACERLTGHMAQDLVGTDLHWKPFRSEKRPIMADLILDGINEEQLWRLYGGTWEKSALIEGGYEAEEYFPHVGPEGSWLFFTAVPIKTPDGTVVGAIETIQDRTRQKQAETEREHKNKELALKVEELIASQKVMSQIINGSTIPTFVIDKEHVITHWNKALESLTGYQAQEMIGTNRQWAPFYGDERPSMADVILDQVEEVQIERLYGSKWRKSLLIQGGYEAELFFPHMGESGKWCWFTAAPIKTAEGEVVGAIETIWDKTEERKAQKEQEQHTRELATFCTVYATLSSSLTLEDRIKAAIEEVANIFTIDGICIFILRPDGHFHLKYSHGYSDNLCYNNRISSPESMITRVAAAAQTAVFKELPSVDNSEMELLRQAGYVSLAYLPILDKNKRALGVIRAASNKARHFDTNDIRALELIANRIGVAIENALLQEDIRRRANFQARLIGSSSDGIVATNDKWQVVIFNSAAEQIFGYARSEVVGIKDARTFYPPGVVQAFEAVLAQGPQSGRLPWHETTISSKTDEIIPVRFSGAILREKHKMMGTVAFFHDLREIKRLEKELLSAERLAAIGQTVAGMAHCVKNILHGLKGGSYMVNLGIEKNNSEKLKSGWDMVLRNIGRTSELVQDLLTYSKEREPELEPCLPNEIAADVCALMQEVAQESNVAIVTQFSPAIGEVVLDPRSLHRCLLNLVSNAIDACRYDEDGNKAHRVVVSTDLEEQAFISFGIQDNGVGMTEEVRAQLFSSFFSTKGAKGTGLGLLVTRKLIEENDGVIEVDSEPGKGTTFRIKLPLKRSNGVKGNR
jgi:PAS domain S-box-containing protein